MPPHSTIESSPPAPLSGTREREEVVRILAAFSQAGSAQPTVGLLLSMAEQTVEVSSEHKASLVLDRMVETNATAALVRWVDSTEVCILTRSRLERELAAPYGRPLFLDRALGFLLTHHRVDTQTLDASLLLTDACEFGLSRKPGHRQDPILVRDSDGRHAVIPFHLLLLAQAESHRIALVELDRQRIVADEALRAREAIQVELVASSRKAGMAEIANGVLHNVGNVLNSTAIALGTIKDRLSRSRLPGLDKAVALLGENRADLSGFFSRERGGQLADYLARLAQQLAQEQAAVRSEFETLTSSVDHLQSIVRAQQRHAGSSVAAEPLTIREIVADALTMERAALTRHNIEIVEQHDPSPEIMTDRHLMLQILVNLITNAKRAIDDNPGGERRIFVHSYSRTDAGGAHAVLVVEDTGVGIPAENMSRLFSLGFTTRTGGHGFGLHNSANSIQQLGGRIEASSDGAGRGARFTITLPAKAGARQPSQAVAA
jgi:signal transduction histidine kinase